MQEAEHEVVGVLVLVAVLEGEDLEHGVWQHIRDSDAHLRRAAPVETLSFENALDEVVAHEIGATNVERSDDRTGGTRLRSEDEPGRHRFGLAQELDDDLGALDFSRPAKPGLLLVEVGLFQVVLEGPVGLRRLVAEREADDEVHVGGPDVSARAFRQLPDEIPRREAADEEDALAPRSEVAKQRDERTLAPRGRRVVVVREVVAAQNPITSRRRVSACS